MDVILSEADGLELPVGRFDVLAPCLPVVVDVVDIKASRLILVVEVEAGNAAAVEPRGLPPGAAAAGECGRVLRGQSLRLSGWQGR